MTNDAELLATLLADEQRLIFPYFDYQNGWELGSAMREAALEANFPIAILIRRNGQRIFHAALPGSSIDNDDWLERKSAVVRQFGHSSYYMGCQARADGEDFNSRFRLDTDRFAAHGGAFPLAPRVGASDRSPCPGCRKSKTIDSSSDSCRATFRPLRRR